MAPNDGKDRDDIVNGCLDGIFNSIFDMKPNTELFMQLYKGACLFYNKYTIQKNREQYEIYFQIDMLQWEIIFNLKNDSQQNLEEIIIQIENTHQKLVKNSSNWKNHFLWIQMIGKILIYNPLITKKKLKLTSSFNFETKWKEYLNKGFLIQMNHSNDQAVILLNQFNNKELTQIDKLILEDTFKEWENFMLLKDFLMNEKKDNIYFTFGAYLNLQLESIGNQENEYIQTVCKIQQLFDFIISNKLLALIQKNDESLGVIVTNYKYFIQKNQHYNFTIEQATYNSQLKRIILNFKEYFQNTLKIIKIIRLSLRKQDFQMEQCEQEKINEFKIFQQLRYILRLLESILSQKIKDINDQRNESDESVMFQQEIELIKEELQNLNLANKQFSFANKFQQKLLAFPNATLNKQNKQSFLKEAQYMLKLIEQTEKQVSQLETVLLKKDNLIQYFQSLLNNLNIYYEKQIQEIQNYFNELLLSFKTIIIFQYEIESVSLPEKLIEIKQQYCCKPSYQFIQKQRLNILKLKQQLIAFKECFLQILKIPFEEFQQLQNFINLDEFLLDVLSNFKYFW